VVTTGDGRQSDSFTTHDAGPMTEPCIMLADIDLIVDMVTLCRYLTGLTFVLKTPRYVMF